MKHLLTLFLLVTVVISCETGDCHHRLALVDTLLYKDMDDSAQIELDKITAKNLQETDDRAYYYLLKTQTIFRQGLVIQNDSMIDQSIAYYETSSDKQKLAQAYYFKGRMLCKRGEIKDGMYFLKKAEHQAKDVNDDLLKTKIYMNIGYVNLQAEEFPMAIKYSQIGMKYAKQSRDKELLLICLQNLATAYGYMNQIDSGIYYMIQCEPLLKYASEDVSSATLADLACTYALFNIAKAEEYAMRSIGISPHDNAYRLLAKINASRGNDAGANDYWEVALNTTNSYNQRIGILEDILEYKQQKKEYKEAAEIMNRIIILRDSLIMQHREDSIKEVQQQYELSAMKEKTSRSLGLATVLISVLVVCLLGGGTVYAFQRRRARSGLEKERLTINKLMEEQAKLLRKVEKLSSDKDDKKKQIAELKRKIKAVEERQKTMVAEMESRMKDVMAKGKELYDEICSDGTIAKWSSYDATCFTEYYVSTHKEFVSRLSDDYTKLTDNRKIFLILLDMKKDSDAICRIMNVKQSTLRTFRLRTKDIVIKE